MGADDRLDPDRIGANLRAKRVGRRIVVFDRTSSTNDVAAQHAGNASNDGLVVFAEEQTAGRGRNGARWHAEHGRNILCSVLLFDSGIGAELLSLTCAVAVAEAIGKVGASQARVKWPNDVVLNGKKVAGILLESKQAGEHSVHIIGVGINCHTQIESFPVELRRTATSIDIESGSRCDRVVLAKRLLTSLDDSLARAKTRSDSVLEAWQRLSTQLGQRVRLSYDGKTFAGHCIGVDPEQGLILQLDGGGVRMFQASHTSIVR